MAHSSFVLRLPVLPVIALVAGSLFCACSDETTTPPASSDGGDAGGGGNGDGGGGGNGDGGGGVNGAAACTNFCTSVNFDEGVLTELPTIKMAECQCSGAGGEVTKPLCSSYCDATYGSPDGVIGSESGNVKADKCVCNLKK